LIFDILKELDGSTTMVDDMLGSPAHTLAQAIDLLQDSGVLKKIVELQNSQTSTIYETCMDILDKFFPDI